MRRALKNLPGLDPRGQGGFYRAVTCTSVCAFEWIESNFDRVRPLYRHRLLWRANALATVCRACASIRPSAMGCRSRSRLGRRPAKALNPTRVRGVAGRAVRPACADADRQAMVANDPKRKFRAVQETTCAQSEPQYFAAAPASRITIGSLSCARSPLALKLAEPMRIDEPIDRIGF